MLNALTIDVEDYFQVSNFSKFIRFSDWDNYECRVEKNTESILDILNHFNVKATFFILGWIAERYPGLIKTIWGEGHEIASHGYAHRSIWDQTATEFGQDVRISKQILEDIIGERIIGYRAPSYSITQNSNWIFKILIDEGFKYDSSVFPVRHYRYGSSNTPRFPYIITVDGPKRQSLQPLVIHNSSFVIQPSYPIDSSNGFIIEFPITTLKVLSENLPIAGGGYFRLFPYQITKWALKKINQKEQRPFVFYIHPWELDQDQPRLKKAPIISRFRHYVHLGKTELKLKRLLEDFKFSTVKSVLGHLVDS